MATDPRFEPVDAALTPRFADVATFMRTRRHEIMAEIDVGLCGVPFDIGTNFRTGAREEPIRTLASRSGRSGARA